MTLFDFAMRMVGEVKELPGQAHHPYIQWCHMLCGLGPDVADEVAWCSSQLNERCWNLRLPRSKSAAARSWLLVGTGVKLEDAKIGYDVVVLKRGKGEQPGPEVIKAPGHVGLYAGMQDPQRVLILGGNQSNEISVRPFSVNDVLGVRRLA